MNQPASTFRTLDQAFQRDAASHRVDALAAELAAQVGASRGPLLLALLRKEAVPRTFGLVFLLDADRVAQPGFDIAPDEMPFLPSETP